MVECPRDLPVKDRLSVKRPCAECVQANKTPEEIANCIFENMPEGADFCLLVEEPDGIYWAATPNILLVVGAQGRFYPEGEKFIFSNEPVRNILAIFGDFDKYESKIVSTWAKKPTKNTASALLSAFSENTCSLSANLSKVGLSDGAYMYASLEAWT